MGDDVDEADRFLGFAVAGSGLAAKEEGPRRDLEFRVVLQEVVQVQDVQDVQGLALVQVDALDLDVEDRVRPHVRIVAVADVAGQDFLAVLFDPRQLFLEGRVVGKGHEVLELRRRPAPAVTDGIVDERRQLRIGFDEPAAMRNAVGLVREAVREARVELVQRRILEDLRMDFGDAVDAVAAEDGQMSHVDLAIPEDGDVAGSRFIARIEAADFFEPAVVDFFDDEVNARQQFLEHGDGPFFHSFRQDGVVRIGHGADGDVPGRIPRYAFFVHEDAHQFRDDQGRMGVVDVDGHIAVEFIDAFVIFLLIMADDALEAGRYEEVFLHQAQAAAVFIAVVRIEETGNLLDTVLVAEGPAPVADGQFLVELFPRIFRPPQAQRVDRIVVVADDRHIVRYGADRRILFVDTFQVAVFVRTHVGVAAKADIDGLVDFLDFPGIAVDQPVIGQFDLLVVDNALVEQAVLIADAVAMARQLQCCQGIDEAGSQPSQSPIPQARIAFGRDDLIQVPAQVFQALATDVVHIDAQEIRFQEAADEEFDGEIIDLLNLLFGIDFIRADPIFTYQIADHIGDGLIDFIQGHVPQIFFPQDVSFLGK